MLLQNKQQKFYYLELLGQKFLQASSLPGIVIQNKYQLLSIFVFFLLSYSYYRLARSAFRIVQKVSVGRMPFLSPDQQCQST